MEAEKLKKKLNGTVLKGSKVRIEDAKPESKKRKMEQEAENAEATAKSKERSSKKRKREEGVLSGVDLPEGRKVKRGWTEPEGKGRDKEKKRKRKEKEKEGKKEKKREKSKYTNEPELLFKAKLPPTKEYEAASKVKKKKNRKGKKDEITVHEFSKTKRYRHSSTDDVKAHKGGVSHYEEGTGWLNADGQVIEPDAKSHKRKAKQEHRPETALNVNTNSHDPNNEESEQMRPKSSGSVASSYLQSPGTQLRGELDQALAGAQSAKSNDEATHDDKADDSDSVSEISNENDEESDGDAELESSTDAPQLDHNLTPKSTIDTSIISTSHDEAKSTIERTPSQLPPTTKPDPDPSAAPTKPIHPLEALYKRPQPNPGSPKKPTPIQTDFTFFGADADEAGDTLGALPAVPQTPFTRQDLEFRGIRSAAPTPDTAAIGKRFVFPWGGQSEDEDDEDEDGEDGEEGEKGEGEGEGAGEEEVEGGAGGARDDDGDVEVEGGDDEGSGLEAAEGRVAGGKTAVQDRKAGKEESEFEKWFWEHRGETNRAWKRRRREAMKEKRHRENRRLNRRIV
ncbi:MAG: hypothetical protein Q9165_002993 [Trypethelium subeluteriae]